MASVEIVLNELYDKLLLLKYPGVAKASRNDMEEIVLSGENRGFLLSWLLGKTSYVNCEEFLNRPDESTVVEWCSGVGISNNPEELMGRLPIQDQISFLKKLMLFIDSVLLADEPRKHDQVDVLDIYKRCSEKLNFSLKTSQLAEKLSYNETLQVVEDCKDRLKRKTDYDEKTHESKNDLPTNKANPIVDCHSEPKIDLCDPKANSETSNYPDLKERVSDFLKSFENASSWSKSENSESKTIPSKQMGPYIETIHTNMTILKETFQSKDQIANFAPIEPLKRREMALDSTIENLDIAIEEYWRLQKND